MAKTKTKRTRKKRASGPKAEINPFREQHGPTVSAGMARKVVPVIQTLKTRGDITQAEYDALNHYRDQASLAEQSPTRDSCDFSVRGGTDGHGPSLAIISAKRETERLEALLGSLRGICRAVCVDDVSLTQWACKQHGSRERKRGNVVEFVPKGKQVIDFARWELKFAARRMMG